MKGKISQTGDSLAWKRYLSSIQMKKRCAVHILAIFPLSRPRIHPLLKQDCRIPGEQRMIQLKSRESLQTSSQMLSLRALMDVCWRDGLCLSCQRPAPCRDGSPPGRQSVSVIALIGITGSRGHGTQCKLGCQEDKPGLCAGMFVTGVALLDVWWLFLFFLQRSKNAKGMTWKKMATWRNT